MVGCLLHYWAHVAFENSIVSLLSFNPISYSFRDLKKGKLAKTELTNISLSPQKYTSTSTRLISSTFSITRSQNYETLDCHLIAFQGTLGLLTNRTEIYVDTNLLILITLPLILPMELLGILTSKSETNSKHLNNVTQFINLTSSPPVNKIVSFKK